TNYCITIPAASDHTVSLVLDSDYSMVIRFFTPFTPFTSLASLVAKSNSALWSLAEGKGADYFFSHKIACPLFEFWWR
ncbi:MAG: hypothetical protein NT022_00465, partial [Deltaproteobacteria bacterium]|nr:hypothetical protein [Deltaproteobacteria bacterium]